MSNLLAQLQQYFDVYHFLLRGEHYVGLGVRALKLVGHWLHIPILCLVALLVVFAVAYQLWCWRERARLLEGTHYVSTAHGFIDYQWYGSGPVVLVLHGTPGGSDQGGIWHQLLLGGENLAVLAPSRFGYVGTRSESTSNGGKADPSSSLTLAQQAEAISDLLHALDLTRVAVVGIGGGGPLAMELVKNYPHKFWALVLIGAITRNWQPSEVVTFNNEVDTLERFIFEQINGMCMWAYYLLSTLSPSTVLRSLYAAGSSLDAQAAEKHMRAAMEKMTHQLALRRAARSCLPPSLRLDGINRDYALFASLPEQIDMGRAADSVPALIVHGKADQSVSASQHAEPVHAAIAGSELYLVDEGSDMLWLGLEGEAVSRKVLSFLMTHMERGKVDELPHLYPPSNLRAALIGGGASGRRKARAPSDTSKPKHKRKKDKEG